MESEKLEGLLIDYIDGRLTTEQQAVVDQELATNPAARALHAQLREVLNTIKTSGDMEPGNELQREFERSLQMEIAGTRQAAGKQVHFRPVFFRAAAAVALVMAGVVIGFWVNKNWQRDEELAALKKEVEATKQMMMSKLNDQQSASNRMTGVTVAFAMDKADDQIVQALAKAMNDDPNTNVRLAALEALGKFRQQGHVRKILIASLVTQKDPVIQIALIRLLVEMKEKEAVKELRRLSTDQEVIPAVKDEAHAGILKLS